LGINLSQVCVSDLPDYVRREQNRRWGEDHADCITAYKRIIETEELPLEEWRHF
jgi:antitoxin CcdA